MGKKWECVDLLLKGWPALLGGSKKTASWPLSPLSPGSVQTKSSWASFAGTWRTKSRCCIRDRVYVYCRGNVSPKHSFLKLEQIPTIPLRRRVLLLCPWAKWEAFGGGARGKPWTPQSHVNNLNSGPLVIPAGGSGKESKMSSPNQLKNLWEPIQLVLCIWICDCTFLYSPSGLNNRCTAVHLSRGSESQSLGDLAAEPVRLPCPERGGLIPLIPFANEWKPWSVPWADTLRNSGLSCYSLNPFNLDIWRLIPQLFENLDLSFSPMGHPTEVRLKLAPLWDVLCVSQIRQGVNQPAPADARIALQPAAFLWWVTATDGRRNEPNKRNRAET